MPHCITLVSVSYYSHREHIVLVSWTAKTVEKELIQEEPLGKVVSAIQVLFSLMLKKTFAQAFPHLKKIMHNCT